MAFLCVCASMCARVLVSGAGLAGPSPNRPRPAPLETDVRLPVLKSTRKTLRKDSVGDAAIQMFARVCFARVCFDSPGGARLGSNTVGTEAMITFCTALGGGRRGVCKLKHWVGVEGSHSCDRCIPTSKKPTVHWGAGVNNSLD